MGVLKHFLEHYMKDFIQNDIVKTKNYHKAQLTYQIYKSDYSPGKIFCICR